MTIHRFSLFAALLIPAVAVSQDIARMDEIIRSYVPERFMGSVLVARGDELLLSKAYGYANLEWNIPHTPETKFRIGSVTKQFTAAAILLLEEQGKLKTSDLLSAHMSDIPEAWKDITIHNLLSHTAGLPDFSAMPGFGQTMLLPTTAEKTMTIFRDLPLNFAPGSQYQYSNSNYIVLSHLVEKLSGSTFGDFLEQNVLAPLGMTSSGYDSNTALLTNRASGYSPGRDGPQNASYLDMSLPLGTGGLYSTTGDLLRWNKGLFGGELLSAESLAKMTTPNLGNYAYGLTVTATDRGKQVMHNGGINGFSSMMMYYPDEELLLVALSNLNGPAADNIVGYLDKLAHGQPVILHSERKEIPVAEDVLARYVGSYQLRPGRIITMTAENGQLVHQATGQGKIPLFAESETAFFVKVVEATFEFQKDATGAVTAVIVTQDGRPRTAPRMAPGEVPPPR